MDVCACYINKQKGATNAEGEGVDSLTELPKQKG